MHGIFITGTSTGVGKTHIGVRLARAMRARGIRVAPRKPVESGCIRIGGELVAEDARALMDASGYPGTLDEVCPYRFEPPVSPARAARLANQTLNIEQLVTACLHNSTADFMLVEGAGGFYSPLADDGLNADLAVALQLPVLLVAEDILGCLNQVLLTTEAVHTRGLLLAGVVLNNLREPTDSLMDNAGDLENRLSCPVYTQAFKQDDDNTIDELLAHLMTLPVVDRADYAVL